MADPLQALLWLLILIAGLGLVIGLYRAGLPRTFARDLLHVGAGIWVLGWPAWGGLAIPVAIPIAAVVALLLVPLAARQLDAVASLHRAVSGDGERWSGLVVYAGAHALFTPLGLLVDPVAAGGALWALSLGDGIGGAVGKQVGRTTFRVPWAKRKSVEGTVAVGLLSAVGIALAGWWFGQPVPAVVVAGGAVAGAAAEALAPRASDNLWVPAAVFTVLLWGN